MNGDVATRSVGWPPFVRGARAAFVFLTRIPVGGFAYSPADWAWAPAHFPLVGLVVGTAAAGARHLALGLDPLVAATVAVAVSAWLTGALHEDGLADTFDALGGSHTRKRALAILKDSRIGTYGALALILVTLLRITTLAELGAGGAVALVLAHALARTAPVWLMAWLPYVSSTSPKSTMVFAGRRTRGALVASGWATLACLSCWRFGSNPASVIAAVFTVLLSAIALGVWFRRRIGGITGDCLGAVEQVGEAAALLAALAATSKGFG